MNQNKLYILGIVGATILVGYFGVSVFAEREENREEARLHQQRILRRHDFQIKSLELLEIAEFAQRCNELDKEAKGKPDIFDKSSPYYKSVQKKRREVQEATVEQMERETDRLCDTAAAQYVEAYELRQRQSEYERRSKSFEQYGDNRFERGDFDGAMTDYEYYWEDKRSGEELGSEAFSKECAAKRALQNAVEVNKNLHKVKTNMKKNGK